MFAGKWDTIINLGMGITKCPEATDVVVNLDAMVVEHSVAIAGRVAKIPMHSMV